MFGCLITNTLVKEGNAPLFDDPKNYGLDYEDVSFQASDGINLKGRLRLGTNPKPILEWFHRYV